MSYNDNAIESEVQLGAWCIKKGETVHIRPSFYPNTWDWRTNAKWRTFSATVPKLRSILNNLRSDMVEVIQYGK